LAVKKLKLSFDPNSLQQVLAANLSVVITKQTINQSNTVVWLVFRPFLTNEVSWEDQFELYASQIRNHEVTEMITTSADPGKRYIFQESGFILSDEPGVLGGFQIANETDRTWTMGILQTAQINGTSSQNMISSEIVPPRMLNEIVPLEILEVFMMSGPNPGDKVEGAVNTVRGHAIRLTFGGAIDSISIRYNPKLGMFVRV